MRFATHDEARRKMFDYIKKGRSMAWKWFKKFIAGRVEVWDGATLKRTGRDGYLVCIGERCARVQTEMLTGPVGRVIYGSGVRHWDAPHQRDPMESTDREMVVSIVAKHLTSRRITFEIE